MGISSSYNEETQILSNRAFTNPAIFVPELKKIIFGAESWWCEIKPGEDLSDITDEDINNQWYVQMLRNMSKDK
jgi:L-rhamnose mutarotase